MKTIFRCFEFLHENKRINQLRKGITEKGFQRALSLLRSQLYKAREDKTGMKQDFKAHLYFAA